MYDMFLENNIFTLILKDGKLITMATKPVIGVNGEWKEISMAGHGHVSYAAHAADLTNPHNVTGSQVQVSDEVASLLGMVSPGFVDTALSSLYDNIDNISGILDGTASQQTRWKTYKWSTYRKGSSLSAGGEYSCRIDVKVYDGFTQNPTTGAITPGNLIKTITGATPSQLTPGTYISGCGYNDDGAANVSGWSDLMYVTNSVDSDQEAAIHNPGGYHSYTYWITGLEVLVPYEEFIEVVKSDNESAYPNDGWVSNIHYIKQVGTSVSIPKIMISTYTGSGKSGTNYPTIIALDFIPKFVYIVGTKSAQGTGMSSYYNYYEVYYYFKHTNRYLYEMIWAYGNAFGTYRYKSTVATQNYYQSIQSSQGEDVIKVTLNESAKTLTLTKAYNVRDLTVADTSNTDPEYQMNGSGIVYTVVAIG